MWQLDLEAKPDFMEAMKRVYAWYDLEILDRPPIRFSAHNEEYSQVDTLNKWNNLKERWYDTEYRIESFIKAVEGKQFLGETFPVFWPNLGPNVYAGILGGEIEFGDVTSWVHPIVKEKEDIHKIKFNLESEYFKKLEEMTRYALERCKNKFMVGYTDLHPSLDCVDALRGTTDVCMDMYDDEDFVKQLVDKCYVDFEFMFNYFDKMLKEHNQLSVSWMNIPSFEKMHIPSCDLSAMLSNEFFKEFSLPYVKKEVTLAKHNVFHLDGKEVANHLDDILEIKSINAIQWVQGVGLNKPIMQWIPLVKKCQAAGKGVVVDLEAHELESFIDAVDPKGIYLCMNVTDTTIQKDIIKRIQKW